MKSSGNKGLVAASLVIGLLALAAVIVPSLKTQGTEMQQHLTELKQSLAFNKQVLANYTWLEQQIISLKGEQKKEELYNVQLGPDGKPQKTPLDPNSVSDSDRQRHGLRGRIKEKKIEEYKEYADSIKTLIQQYIPPDKDMLQQSYQQGNVMIGPMAGQPNEYRVIVTNYVKQGDNMTIVMERPLYRSSVCPFPPTSRMPAMPSTSTCSSRRCPMAVHSTWPQRPSMA